MIYLAYIAIGFIGLQLINILANFVFRQKISKVTPPAEVPVSVLIPVRNEEKNIAFLLSDLIKLENYPLEIIVFDDESTDNTVRITEEFSRKDQRIKVIRSEGLPAGWLGKNHACYQLAQNARGQYLLFLDADVRIDASVIPDAIAYMKRYRLQLMSVFPTQILATFGEKASVPVMNYILLTLLPLILVRVSTYPAHAAANGQFMLFEAESYQRLQPHYVFRNSAVEDIAIARFFKKKQLKVACLTGEKRIKCRMYDSYAAAIKGFSKNVITFFGGISLLGFLFWLFSALGFMPVLIALPEYTQLYFIVLAIIIILYAYLSRQNILMHLILYPLHMVFLFTVLLKAVFYKKNKELLWKERNIYV